MQELGYYNNSKSYIPCGMNKEMILWMLFYWTVASSGQSSFFKSLCHINSLTLPAVS